MEDRLRDAFSGLRMPEECAKQIEEKLCKPKEKHMFYAEPVQPSWFKGMAAAAALAAVVLVGNLLLGAPGEANKEPDGLSAGETEETSKFDQYYIRDEEGRVYCRYEYVAQANAESAPEWIMEEAGRLYFVGNSEKIDITGEISLEKPFVYTYTDPENTQWALIAGRTTEGPYVDIGNSVGWFSFYWETGAENWCGGGGTHWSNWMDAEWPWLTQAKQELDIP